MAILSCLLAFPSLKGLTVIILYPKHLSKNPCSFNDSLLAQDHVSNSLLIQQSPTSKASAEFKKVSQTYTTIPLCSFK